MSMINILNSEKFNIFFSIALGIGIVCVLKPMCSGSNCSVEKPPVSNDFDKYVYKMGKKCYEFIPEIIPCPQSGTIEAFKECNLNKKETEGYEGDYFTRRISPIKRCE
jgi:hypothetical protein